MRLFTILGLMLSWCLVSPAHAQETAQEKKQKRSKTAASVTDVHKKLDGQWEIVRGANQGSESKADHIQDTLVVIREHTIVVLDPDENELYKAQFELDTSTKPIQINMVTKMPNNPETKALGILRFTKTGWTLCYALPGQERPEKFHSPEGGQIMLFEMKKHQKRKSHSKVPKS